MPFATEARIGPAPAEQKVPDRASPVPADLLQELASPQLTDLAPLRLVSKGRIIGVQGQECDRLYLIVEGQVLLSRRDAEEEHALFLLGPGEIFGIGSLLPDCRWLATSRAVTDCLVRALPGTHVDTLARYSPRLAAQLFAVLAARVERANRRLGLVVRPSSRDRLLGLLGILADHLGEPRGEDVWLPIQLTQGQLGEMAGLARETVTRMLTELEEEGTIRREGRRGLWLRAGFVMDPEGRGLGEGL